MAKKRSGLVRDKFPEMFSDDNLFNTIQLDDEAYRKALAEKIADESKHLIDTVVKDKSATSILVVLAEIEDLSHSLPWRIPLVGSGPRLDCSVCQRNAGRI